MSKTPRKTLVPTQAVSASFDPVHVPEGSFERDIRKLSIPNLDPLEVNLPQLLTDIRTSLLAASRHLATLKATPSATKPVIPKQKKKTKKTKAVDKKTKG